MEKIKEILASLRPEFDFETSEDFVEDGFLDSFDIATLVMELEKEFTCVIDGMDITPANFASYQAIYDLVNK